MCIITILTFKKPRNEHSVAPLCTEKPADLIIMKSKNVLAFLFLQEMMCYLHPCSEKLQARFSKIWAAVPECIVPGVSAVEENKNPTDTWRRVSGYRGFILFLWLMSSFR